MMVWTRLNPFRVWVYVFTCPRISCGVIEIEARWASRMKSLLLSRTHVNLLWECCASTTINPYHQLNYEHTLYSLTLLHTPPLAILASRAVHGHCICHAGQGDDDHYQSLHVRRRENCRRRNDYRNRQNCVDDASGCQLFDCNISVCF